MSLSMFPFLLHLFFRISLLSPYFFLYYKVIPNLPYPRLLSWSPMTITDRCIFFARGIFAICLPIRDHLTVSLTLVIFLSFTFSCG